MSQIENRNGGGLSKFTKVLAVVTVFMFALSGVTLVQLKNRGLVSVGGQKSNANWWQPKTEGCFSITDAFKRAACINATSPPPPLPPPPSNTCVDSRGMPVRCDASPPPTLPVLRDVEVTGQVTLFNISDDPGPIRLLSGTATVISRNAKGSDGSLLPQVTRTSSLAYFANNIASYRVVAKASNDGSATGANMTVVATAISDSSGDTLQCYGSGYLVINAGVTIQLVPMTNMNCSK